MRNNPVQNPLNPKPTRIQQATDWLKAHLMDGLGHPMRDLEVQAHQEGISVSQFPRAKVRLGVKSYKRGKQWLWTLGASPPAL